MSFWWLFYFEKELNMEFLQSLGGVRNRFQIPKIASGNPHWTWIFGLGTQSAFLVPQIESKANESKKIFQNI